VEQKNNKNNKRFHNGLKILPVFLLFVAIMILYAYRLVDIWLKQSNRRDSISDRGGFIYSIRSVKGERGTIYDRNGNIIAVTYPVFDFYFDAMAKGLDKQQLEREMSSMCSCISKILKRDVSIEVRNRVLMGLKRGDRAMPLLTGISYELKKEIEKCPYVKEGANKSGIYAVKRSERFYPYGGLGGRIIGYFKEGVGQVGIEGTYISVLEGSLGRVLYRREPGGLWIPVESPYNYPATDGMDIITTLDMNVMEIASRALESKMRELDGIKGCVIVMEVKTGDIWAMVNLTATPDGKFVENYNYAIQDAMEPGSTIKTAILMALLEDGFVKLDDTVYVGDGKITYYNKTISDVGNYESSYISVREAFYKSSNVAFSWLAFKHYRDDPYRLIKRLYQFGFGEKTGIGIIGEASPLIKTPESKTWSGTTLPWMAIGYEIKVTPIQMVAFYNAIANGGNMVKPRLVLKIQKNGEVVRDFTKDIQTYAIARRDVVENVKEALAGVVRFGTAKVLSSLNFSVAGKTGTALVAQIGKGYNKDEKPMYLSSFVGFFPVEEPRFTIYISIISQNTKVYYGGLVAAPVFKSIAEKLIATTPVFARYVNKISNNET